MTTTSRTRDERRFSRLDQPRDPGRALMPRPHYDPEAFGRFSERIARFLGTARFLVYMTLFVGVWLLWNVTAPRSLEWDPYPFIFLTLILSLQASYAAPLILLAQNRQADRDRAETERDREVNARNLAETAFLARELASIRLALERKADREDLVEPLERLTHALESLHGVEIQPGPTADQPPSE